MCGTGQCYAFMNIRKLSTTSPLPSLLVEGQGLFLYAKASALNPNRPLAHSRNVFVCFRLVRRFFVAFPLYIPCYAFEKNHQKTIATRIEIKQSIMIDLGIKQGALVSVVPYFSMASSIGINSTRSCKSPAVRDKTSVLKVQPSVPNILSRC